MDYEARILVVDDEESIRGVVSDALAEKGLHIDEASSGETALEAIKQNKYQLVMTDIRMDGMDGIVLLQRSKTISPNTEVIIMTSHASMETAISALRFGAYDYLVKPFEDISLVSAAAHRALEKVWLTEENKSLMEKLAIQNKKLARVSRFLKELAFRDGLTGLYNHRYFHESLKEGVLRAVRHGRPLSAMLIDVDHFKTYNDAHGHPAGDRLLKSLAKLITSRMRKSDVAARYGGDEFVALLYETEKDDAKEVAESLLGLVAKHPFEGGQTQPLGRVTLSIGVSAVSGDLDDASALLQRADEALYEVKQNGKNNVRSKP